MASQAATLPKCVAFRSKENGKYLRYVCNSGEPIYKSLHMSGEDAINPFTRFYLEPAKSEEHDGLVHIRCSYNSKYWVARNVGGKWWVQGDANEPVEDTSSPACTLFKTIIFTQDTTADESDGNSITSCRILHRQPELGEEDALVFTAGDGGEEALKGCMQLQLHAGGSSEEQGRGEYTMLDVSNYLLLPRNVCFLGDNDRFLRGVSLDGPQLPYLQFSSNNILDPDIRMVIVHDLGSSGIRIRSVRFDRLWTRRGNWIRAEANNWDTGRDTRFRVEPQSGGTIALRSLRDNRYCKRMTTEGKTNCLFAELDHVTPEARMRIRETITSREILDVEYDLLNATVHDGTEIALGGARAENTTDEARELTLAFTYRTRTERRWDASVGLTLGTNVRCTAGIPLILRGEVDISGEFSGSYTWGTPVEITQEITASYKVVVPPRTRVVVSMVGTESKLTVPFTYTQQDVLTDGTGFTEKMLRGRYTGTDVIVADYKVQQEPL